MSDTDAATRGSWLRAIWAAALSFFQPGLGQVYAGAWKLGVALYVVGAAYILVLINATRFLPPTPAFAAAFLLGFLPYLAIPIDAVLRVRRPHARAPVRWFRSTWTAAAVMLAVWVGLSFASLNTPGWRAFSIPSGSNLPTLVPGDYVFGQVGRANAIPAYGDMLLFGSPRDPNTIYIKRVVGLPGDRVQLVRGTLVINGQQTKRQFVDDWNAGPMKRVAKRYEETLSSGRSYYILASDEGVWENTAEYLVPPRHLFVLGDYRDDSLDSRMLEQFGFVPMSNVLGPAVTIYWSKDPSRMFSLVR
jgi:signal peptidase I